MRQITTRTRSDSKVGGGDAVFTCGELNAEGVTLDDERLVGSGNGEQQIELMGWDTSNDVCVAEHTG